jgi:hypothetical protein
MDFIKERIGRLVSSGVQKAEFSHTIFHGFKGGEEPKFQIVPDEEEKPKPKPTAPPPAPASAGTPKVAPAVAKPSGPTATGKLSTTGKVGAGGTQKLGSTSGREAALDAKKKKDEEEKKKHEEENKKRADVAAKAAEREAERKKKMEDMKREERERKKKFENLESGFKKTKAQIAAQGGNPDDPLFIPAGNDKKGTMRAAQVGDRSGEVDALRAMIKQKRAEKTASGGADGVLQIGTVSVDLGKSTAPQALGDLIDLDVSDDGPNEFETLAALTAGVSGGDDDEGLEKFFYKGKEIPLPDEDKDKRLEAVRVFCKKCLTPDKFLAAYNWIKDPNNGELTEEQSDAALKKILKSDDELEYVPVIRQLVCLEEE